MSEIPERLMIPMALAIVCVVVVVLGALFPSVLALSTLVSAFQTISILLATFALLIGVVSTLLKHGKVVTQRKENWPYSLWLFFLICFMFVTGLISPIGTHPWFKWVFKNVQQPIDIGIYALLPCYLFLIAYKGFRIRNIPSALFVCAAFFTMMLNAPIGYAIWPGLPAIGDWVQSVPGLAGSRGIMFGIGLGLIFLLVRVVIGKEKSIAGG